MTYAPNDDSMWMIHGLCRHCADLDLWFPDKEHGDPTTRADKAIQICFQCPMQDRCLDWALAGDERWGIWGGENLARYKPADLDRIRRQRGITITRTPAGQAQCGTEAGHKRHTRAGEQPCRPCTDAANLASRLRRNPGGAA